MHFCVASADTGGERHLHGPPPLATSSRPKLGLAPHRAKPATKEPSHAEDVHRAHLGHVLVASAAHAQQNRLVARPTAALRCDPADRVRGLQRRDDPLQPAQKLEALERLVSWRPPIEVGPIVAGYYRGYAELDPGNARRFRDLERFLQTDKDFRHAFISDPGAAALVRDTLTPTVLHASSKTNVVPATAWAEVDSRLLPGHECEKFLDMVRARVADVPQVRIDPAGASFPATESPLNNDLTAAVERLAAGEGERAAVLPGLLTGFTDSHWFRERGIAAYGFAPIEATPEQRHSIHGPEESVDAAALEKGVERFVTLIREFAR